MYRVLKLNESMKLKEKDAISDYKDYCKDKGLNPSDQSSKDSYIKDFSKWYAQYNGLATLKAAKQKVRDKLNTLKEGKEYRYVTTHGIGPGTLPNGVYIKSEELKNGKTAIYTNRPLTSEELKKYDIKDEWIQEGEHLKANRNFIEELIKAGALDDYDELKNDEKAFNDAVDYWVEHYFDDYSDTEIKQAKEDGIAYDVARDLGIEPGSEEENQLNGLYEAEDEETAEDIEQQNEIEDNAEETVDSEDDQDENPIEEESDLDKELDEIRNILVDLDDIRLYKIVGDDDEFYILGKVSDSSNDVEMLVDTQPADVYDNPEESGNEIVPQEQIESKFQFVTLPKKIDMIKDMYPKYGKELNPRHEELISYLTNLLIEQNPEAAEELNNEEGIEINEPENNLPDETPEELDEPIINNKEDEEDYE